MVSILSFLVLNAWSAWNFRRFLRSLRYGVSLF
jgi:hypothetical protein